MQRNWIGRSPGAWVDFESPAGPITVFTTRPDTLFGATFMVLAPEHPLVADLTTSQMASQVVQYRDESAAFGEDERRQDEDRQKTGVFTGSYATNPVNGEDVPIWIADYVLMGYGTGAIMAVPCGDQRDFEFARVFGLDIPAIQHPPDEWFEARGIAPTLDTRRWPEAFVGDAPVRQLVEQVACRPQRDDVGRARASPRPTRGWRPRASARRRSRTSCATGCSAASATGASRSRSSTTSTATRTSCPTTSCR